METKTPETFEQQKKREARENGSIRDARYALLSKALNLAGFKPEPRDVDKEYAFSREMTLKWHRDDATIFAAAETYGAGVDRVSFSGSYPSPKAGAGSTYGVERVSISCSLSKTAEQLAADIKRRFLPEYEKNLALVRERNAATENYQAGMLANLALVLGRPATDDEERDGRTSFRGISLGEVWGKGQAFADSFTLELHGIKPEHAARIIAELRAAAGKED